MVQIKYRNRNAGTGNVGKTAQQIANKRKADTIYQKSKVQIKNRVMRNKARRYMIRKGKVKIGSSNDVDHITPLKSGGNNQTSNLRVISRKINRGRTN